MLRTFPIKRVANLSLQKINFQVFQKIVKKSNEARMCTPYSSIALIHDELWEIEEKTFLVIKLLVKI